MYKKCIAVVVIAIIWYFYQKEKDLDLDQVLKGKNVLITGASSGIGEQLAYEYAKFGANVFITARREKLLQQVVNKCSQLGDKEGRHGYVIADMEQYDTAANVVINAAVKHFGSIDYLILNHAVLPNPKRWTGTSEELKYFVKEININLVSYVHLASVAMPYLLDSDGKIGVVSSLGGKVEFPYGSGYSTAKFGLDGFFSSIRQELRSDNQNVTITLCLLGWIDTDTAKSMLSQSGPVPYRVEENQMENSNEAAKAIIKATVAGRRELYFPQWPIVNPGQIVLILRYLDLLQYLA